MAFYDKVVAEEGNLAVHDIAALTREILRGNITQEEAAKSLGLDSGEAVEFESLVKSVKLSQEVEAIWDILYLGQRGVVGYTSGAELEARVTGGNLKPVAVIKAV